MTGLTAIAVASVFQAGLSTSAAVPSITKRTAAGIAIVDLYNAVKEYLAPQNAYVSGHVLAIQCPVAKSSWLISFDTGSRRTQ